MIRRLFLKLFRRRSLEQDLEAELAFHREMAQANGNPIPLGNTSVIKEHAFDVWRFTAVENLWRDLLYAVRALRKSPGFVLTALPDIAPMPHVKSKPYPTSDSRRSTSPAVLPHGGRNRV